MGSGFKRRSGAGANKNVPYLSHEFVIQNHADIVTCVVMVFVAGLMFQVTTPLASVFVVPQYNTTQFDTNGAVTSVTYGYGLKDAALVFFYSLAAVIFHAVIQEYVLDVSI
jgi:translocating chain-associated membrane protein 1